MTSKLTGKRLWIKISLIVLVLALGAGVTLLMCRPDLRTRCANTVAGALSLDKPAAAAGFHAVATENLDIRSGSGSSYNVICTVPKGTSVELLSKPAANSQWVQVKTSDEKNGWCLSKALDFDESKSSSSAAPSSSSSAVSSAAPPVSSAAPKPDISKAVAAAQVSLDDAKFPFSIQVSIANQRVTVYDANKRIIKQFVCSSGKKGSETPIGTFYIADKGKSFYSASVGEGGYYWTEFNGGEYLFHSVPFDKNYQLEPEEAAKLGTPASHGCVRLSIADAKWIYTHVPRGTKVTIQ